MNERSRGIGGSQIAAAAGVDSRMDPFDLWALITGRAAPMEPNSRMTRGLAYERPTAEIIYPEITGRQVRWSNQTFWDPEVSYLRYSPDAFTEDNRILEVKLVHFDQVRTWGDGNTEQDLPPRVRLQCQYYLWRMRQEYERCDVIAMMGGWADPQIYEIVADPELHLAIAEIIDQFWTDYVIPDKPPEPGPSAFATAILSRMYPRNTGPVRWASPEEIRALRLYGQVRQHHAAYEQVKNLLENGFRLRIGDLDGMKWPGGKFTWKAARDTSAVDKDALIEELMKDLAAGEKLALRQRFEHTVPGSRRIHFHCEPAELRVETDYHCFAAELGMDAVKALQPTTQPASAEELPECPQP